MAGRATPSRVALAKGGNRAENIESALKLIHNDIDLTGKSDILIKVNFVSTTNQLAATHVDAIRPLLRFVRERYDGRITIGESTSVPAREGFVRFGYTDLVDEFDVQLIDLNEGQWINLDVYDSELRSVTVRFSKQVAESDYLIAIGPPKTHDTVVVTLSIKNVAMGSLFFRVKVGSGGIVRNMLRKGYHLLPSSLRRSTTVSKMRDAAAVHAGGDKRKIHQGYPVHNLNLYLLARECLPHLSIIDGYTGMDGNGPESGDSVDWGIAIASQDPVAADCLTARLMGFDVADIGYLWYCCKKGLGTGDIDRMEIVGANPQDCCRRFLPPPTYEDQKCWQDDRISRLLEL